MAHENNNHEDQNMNDQEQPSPTTQELLHIMVAGQAQLQKDIQTLIQHIGNKNSHEPSTALNESLNSEESRGLGLTENEKKMIERMDQMEKLLLRSRRVEEAMDLHSFSLFPQARAPPKFKMPTLDKFDGTGCPKAHLKMYMRALQPLGASEELMAQMFQNTLTGAALRWFLNLDDSRTRNWEDIGREFYKQYKYNTEVDVTRRDLETTKQDSKESFSAFITRWRAKAAQMTVRPNEEEQLNMVVKNLLPAYNKYLFAQYFPSFKALIAAGTQIEDAINTGILKGEEVIRSKRPFGPSSSKVPEISAISKQSPFQLVASPPLAQAPLGRPRRQYHELHMPLSKVFEKLREKDLLRPLDPKPIPNPLPKWFDNSKRCAFHQTPGHATDQCYALKNSIQDLIDQEIISPPARPNITTNPLPNHVVGQGPKINCLIEEESKTQEELLAMIQDIPSCNTLIWEELMIKEPPLPKPRIDIWNEEEKPTSPKATSPQKEPTSFFRLTSQKPTFPERQTHTPHKKPNLYKATGIAHLTRGGRHFKPSYLEADDPVEALNRPSRPTQLQLEDDLVLKQLQKTQATISLWGLLTASYHHRQALLNLLNKIQVPTTITPEALNAMIGVIRTEPTISFSDKDISDKGYSHNDPLHITIDTHGKRVPMVLVDDGSALNVCPLRTASCLGLNMEDFGPSNQYVRAYDNTRREVLGNVTLEITIGPTVQKVHFQVLDISACFNLLLGRPWIHTAKAIPSSLYQKVRFPYKESIITIHGDKFDTQGLVHGIQVEEDLALSGFDIEEVQAISWSEEAIEEFFPMDFDPYSNDKVVSMMRKMDYFPGLGLGRNNQGLLNFTSHATTIPPFGLGYKPTDEDLLEEGLKKIARSKAKVKGLSYEPSTLKPYTLTLNGKFVKEGEVKLYSMFPEPWYDQRTATKLPGIEIFADCKTEAPKVEEKKIEDWASHLDPNAMAALLDDLILNMGEGNWDDEVPLIWTPTTAMNNWEVFQNDYEDLEELVGGIGIDQFLVEDDARSWGDLDFELENIGENMESLKIRRTTLDEMHMVYENGIIPDEGELNTFLDVPTSYSWLPENTTPYSHYREDEDYEGDVDEDYFSKESCLTEDEDHDSEEVSTHNEGWKHTGMEMRIVEDDDSIYSEGNNSLYGFPHSEFGSLTPYTDEEDNPRDSCALLEKQIMFHDFKKLTIQDSEEEESINPHQEEDADYMDISSEYSRDDPMEIDEIYMLRSGEAYKEVPAITTIISELKNWTWEGSCPVEDHQKETKFFESTKIIVPIESISTSTPIPINFSTIETVVNSFNDNKMIPDSAYLLALNIFISEINNEMSSKGFETNEEQGHVKPIKEEIQSINLGSKDEQKMIQIGNTLNLKEKNELIILLQEYEEIFAWSYEDMPGIDTDIVQHRIPTDPTIKPVKQKLRRMKPEWTLKIKEEVEKQYNAGFLQVVNYPEWLANVVPVPKKDGKVRMCVDFRDLNKASPKDDFPLPHIDILVDNTAGHALLSFMDGFSGYNQIKMAPEDI